MILLAEALEQRLIRGILDERVLELTGSLWDHPALVDQLGLD
jgi:hypothetical protein